MRTLDEADFVSWTRAHGMALHNSYPTTAILNFTPDRGHDRFVVRSLGARAAPPLYRHDARSPRRLDILFRLEAFRAVGRIRRTRSGSIDRSSWKSSAASACRSERPKWSNSTATEFDRLVTLIFSGTIFGWAVIHDLYVIPDTLRGHHCKPTTTRWHPDASFRSGTDLERYVDDMARAGFPLPSDVPVPRHSRHRVDEVVASRARRSPHSKPRREVQQQHPGSPRPRSPA